MAMTLRLPDDLNDKLRRRANDDHRSMQAVAILAIQAYLEQEDRRTDLASALDEVHTQFGDALRRLGDG